MSLKITYKTTLFKALGGRITQTFEIVKLFSKIQAQNFYIDKYNFICNHDKSE